MTRENYHEKRAARIEALSDRAAAKAIEAESAWERGSKMAEAIPMGQPILVGHHSEKRDRRYREKIHNTFTKAAATAKDAESLARRAEAAESNRAISSDDPEAVARLREKVAKLEAAQEKMKAANKALKKGDDAALAALGFRPDQVAYLKTSDFCGRTGFPSYAITNNGAEIRRAKKRLAEMEALAAKAETPSSETEVAPGVTVVENHAANRLQVFFPGKPSDQARAALKTWGFRWAPTEGAWQRHLTGATRETAMQALRAGGVVPSKPIYSKED